MLKYKIESNQHMPPMVSYRFWDRVTQKVYPVFSLHYNETEILETICINLGDKKTYKKAYEDGEIIPSTGLYTGHGQELFFHDMVACKYLGHSKPLLLFWENGWRVMSSTAKDFETNLDKVYRIGSRWDLPDLYTNYVAKISPYVNK